MVSLSAASEARYLSLLNGKAENQSNMLKKLPHLLDELYGANRNGRPTLQSNTQLIKEANFILQKLENSQHNPGK